MTDAASNQKQPDACSFVIFGVTGDLAHRLVFPALYNLVGPRRLPNEFQIVGVDLVPMFDPIPAGVRGLRARAHVPEPAGAVNA